MCTIGEFCPNLNFQVPQNVRIKEKKVKQKFLRNNKYIIYKHIFLKKVKKKMIMQLKIISRKNVLEF